jgi:hypothetical protein
VLVLSPALVFTIINPSILNLSLNLPALATSTSATNGAGGTGSGTNSTTITCGGTVYSKTEKTPVPTNQFCANVLKNDASGNNWVGITSSCITSSTVIDAACSGAKPDPTCQLCGLSTNKVPANQPAATNCTVTGTSGLLQIADCPTNADAQLWVQHSCNDINNTSTITAITKNSDGTPAESAVTCATTRYYVFVNLRGGIVVPNVIGELAAIALVPQAAGALTNTSYNPNNGSLATTFASICQSADSRFNFKTCISDDPLVTSSIACPNFSTKLPAGANGKCYNENLTCQQDPWTWHTIGQDICGSPNWTIIN